MNEGYITDEKGMRHSHCHGVTAKQWRDTVRVATIMLSKPDYRARYGLLRIEPDKAISCDDPDCQRLNRRDVPGIALYCISQDIQPVRPSNPESAGERQLCEGHPFKAGSHLCRSCAIMATTKRLIDEERYKQ